MANGNWGTPKDIKAFQSAYGKGLAGKGKALSVDGVLGRKTATAMNTPQGRRIVNRLSYQPTAQQQAAGQSEGFSEYVNANGMPTSTAPVSDSLAGLNYNTDAWGAMLNATPQMQNEFLFSVGDNWSQLSAEQQAKLAEGMTGMKSDQLFGTDLSNIGTAGKDSGWWTQNKDMIGGIAQGIQAGAGLANAYLGYKNYGLAKDQFNFSKAAANRDVSNQAQLINNEIQNAGEVGMSLAGNTMSPEQRAARQQQLNAMRVSGAPIG